MGRKKTKEIKHTLKTKIDAADAYIKLSMIGDVLLKSPEDRKQVENTRETIIENLTRLKKEIPELMEKFIAEVDIAIEKMK